MAQQAIILITEQTQQNLRAMTTEALGLLSAGPDNKRARYKWVKNPKARGINGI